jgi:hypothetical protein
MMKYFYRYLIIFSVCVLGQNANATTHVWFWINGDTAHVATQGDQFAWEIDVASPGNTVLFELFLDLDQSRDVTEGVDLLLGSFFQQDGGQDDGPSDSSAVPDGIIYADLGSFGFAPQDYLIRAKDEDESQSTGWFTMLELSDPPATIYGSISIEGTSPPNPLYQNVMIGGLSEIGITSGLTDQFGDYQINLSSTDNTWELGPLFDNILPGYILQEEGYEVVASDGANGPYNFNFLLPQAYVYGEIKDQNGSSTDINGFIRLENTTTDDGTDGNIQEGTYILPAIIQIQGNDSTNYFRFRADDQGFVPDYLVPEEREDFPLSVGDSLRHDLIAYETDTMIYGFVTKDGGNPDQSYEIHAWSDSLGYTNSESDPSTGSFILHVRNGSAYSVNLQDDPEWGTPPPPGYYVEQNHYFNVQPGDTVYFRLLPAQAALSGTISFDPGDPVMFDYQRNRVMASDTNYTFSYNSGIEQDNTFSIAVPNGTYHVSLNMEDDKYLTLPAEYQNIVVEQDTVDTLDFFLNYGHADVTVRFIGATFPEWFEGYDVISSGQGPNIYHSWQWLESDSTVHFKLCEGEWNFNAPPDFGGDLTPKDTVLVLTENDSSAYIEFVYSLSTSIVNIEEVPASYYMNPNYPNPFNPSTTIMYGIAKTGHVKLDIYNQLGQRISTLIDRVQRAGRHFVQWKPDNMASGIYIYRLTADGHVFSRKMLFMK